MRFAERWKKFVVMLSPFTFLAITVGARQFPADKTVEKLANSTGSPPRRFLGPIFRLGRSNIKESASSDGSSDMPHG